MPAPVATPAAARFAGHQVSEEVLSAVRLASSRTGVDFSYLMRQAAQESGFKPEAKARSSSATGLYQFIDRTWLQMVRDHGAKYGLGDLAAEIDTAPGGKPVVADAATRQRILDLRYDPKISAVMAAEFARGNREVLARELGGKVGSTELYMAHFLGAGGATKFLSALRSDPTRPAAELLPDAAAANKAVFYDRASGRALGVAEVYDRFAARMTGQAAEPAAPVAPAKRALKSEEIQAARAPTSPSTMAPDIRIPGRRMLSPVMMVALATLGDPLTESAPRNDAPRAEPKPRVLRQRWTRPV